MLTLSFWLRLTTGALTLAVSLGAPAQSGGFFVADDTRTLVEVLEQVSNAQDAGDAAAAYAIVVKDTQVGALRSGSKAAASVRQALTRKVRIYACGNDLQLFGVKPAQLLPGIQVVATAEAADSNGKARKPARNKDSKPLPLERFTKQVQQACAAP